MKVADSWDNEMCHNMAEKNEGAPEALGEAPKAAKAENKAAKAKENRAGNL